MQTTTNVITIGMTNATTTSTTTTAITTRGSKDNGKDCRGGLTNVNLSKPLVLVRGRSGSYPGSEGSLLTGEVGP